MLAYRHTLRVCDPAVLGRGNPGESHALDSPAARCNRQGKPKNMEDEMRTDRIMTQLHVYVQLNLRERVEEVAHEQRITSSELVRKAITEYCDRAAADPEREA